MVSLSGPGAWRYYLAGGICASTSHTVTTPSTSWRYEIRPTVVDLRGAQSYIYWKEQNLYELFFVMTYLFIQLTQRLLGYLYFYFCSFVAFHHLPCKSPNHTSSYYTHNSLHHYLLLYFAYRYHPNHRCQGTKNVLYYFICVYTIMIF